MGPGKWIYQAHYDEYVLVHDVVSLCDPTLLLREETQRVDC